MLEIYVLNVDKDLERDCFNRFLDDVSEEKKERIRRYHRYSDAQRSLLGDILSRFAVTKKTGLKNSDLVFGVNEYGKPLLAKPAGVFFNISHSSNWVVCAIDEDETGIDVEEIKPIDLKVAERFFSSREYRSLTEQPDTMRQEYFYRIWTLKESYIKAEGKGLSIPLQSFSTEILDGCIHVIADGKTSKYHFFQYLLDNNHLCSVCTVKESAGRMILRDMDGLLSDMRRWS